MPKGTFGCPNCEKPKWSLWFTKYSFITDINQEEKMQLWNAIKVNNCNLVEMPLSVLDL